KKIAFFLFLTAISVGNAVAQGLASKDTRFMEDALQAGVFEIKISELCVTHASTDEVKRLGEMIVVEHNRINTELKGLAGKKNLTLPTTLTGENQKKYDDLAGKSGISFDHAYVALMIQQHESAIASYREENMNGSDTDVRNWAARTIPLLEHHLLKANDAAAQLK
ncbi:MAG: hypothetical protein DI538_29820, partial [Azospira oryzae]